MSSWGNVWNPPVVSVGVGVLVVSSIPQSPVWRCLREELEWWPVDILQATTQADWGLSPARPLGGGRAGETSLNHCQPARASASPPDRPSTAEKEGWWGMFEARRSCLVRVELVASRSEAEFHISRFSRLCEKNKKISPIGGYLLEIMREIT